MQRKYLIISLVLSALLLALHVHALEKYLYWSVSWLDIIMHIFGGLILGFLLLSIFPNVNAVAVSFTGALVLAVIWEIFEYKIGFTPPSERLLTDTAGDLFFGTVGGVTAGLVAICLNKK